MVLAEWGCGVALTKREKKVLREAGDLIARELAKCGVVRVPRFGRFHVSAILMSSGNPLEWDQFCEDLLVPRFGFRSYAGLRAALGDRIQLCGKGVKGSQYVHCRRSRGHEGECSVKRDVFFPWE